MKTTYGMHAEVASQISIIYNIKAIINDTVQSKPKCAFAMKLFARVQERSGTAS